MPEARRRNSKQADYVVIRVRSQYLDKLYFKIKTSTHLKKLIDYYCYNILTNSINAKFYLRGRKIKERDTAGKLGLENDDEIYVLLNN